MGSPISVGDILMLSNLAWKVGRSFANGKRSAPSEFAEVEREAEGLSEALKLVADTFQMDGSVFAKAEGSTRTAVQSILESAQKTLEDLDSFVERYQVIKKKEMTGGFAIDRRWSEAVLANYKTLKWTTEGGNIAQLRDMLHMHANTINLTMQALQSRSLSRLENTVVPMAQEVARIHDRVNGDLGEKIDDIYRIIMAVVSGTPSLMPAEAHRRTSHNAVGGVPTSEPAQSETGLRMLEPPSSRRNPVLWPPERRESQSSSIMERTASSNRPGICDSADYSLGSLLFESDHVRVDWGFENGVPPSDRSSIGEGSVASPGSTAVGSPDSFLSLGKSSSPGRLSPNARPDSMTLPQFFGGKADNHAEPVHESHAEDSPNIASRTRRESRFSSLSERLPPPAIYYDNVERGEHVPATPGSIFATSERAAPRTNPARRPSTPGTPIHVVPNDGRTTQAPVAAGASDFTRSLFWNAVTLCDVRCTLVQTAQLNPEIMDPRFQVEMITACHAGRLLVIRKRENRDTDGTNVFTSIWTLSDDGEVRCQQKLPEARETVPYCSNFEPEKVSLSSDEGEILLRYHSQRWGGELEGEVKTNWINYLFETAEQADQFQSAVFGRMLRGSFRTTKTTVLHEGIKGAFVFEEQFANIEVLRLWEEDGIYTSGADGGVLALMHLASNFGTGWARWWMNSTKQQVQVKDEGGKFVRIKGLDLRVCKPGPGGGTMNRTKSSESANDSVRRRSTEAGLVSRRKSLEQVVTGVRIQFKTEDERKQFVALSKRVQERSLPLPDV